MFEFDQDVVETLLASDDQFKRLFNKHRALKDKVQHANSGTLTLDDLEVEKLKKQKLLVKDQMAGIIAHYRQSHATA
ncbi:MAG: DUF465 domain-containing protein [Gammaproteobacteria bacterium]|nr:DUF465 domain-containing protein [Gammaproteobacteria bacterium]